MGETVRFSILHDVLDQEQKRILLNNFLKKKKKKEGQLVSNVFLEVQT